MLSQYLGCPLVISKRTSYILSKLYPVKVIPKEDLSLDKLGIKIFKGVETEIPKWMADILQEEGKVEVEEISPKKVSEYLYKEKMSVTLTKLPPYTYSLIRELLKSSDDSLVKRDAIDLVNRRVGKILMYLKASIRLDSSRGAPKNLLPEELVLYNTLRKYIGRWIEAFLELKEGE